jgi:hypothetical protein
MTAIKANGRTNLCPSYDLVKAGQVRAKLVNAGLGWWLRLANGKEYHANTIREAVLLWDDLEARGVAAC